MTTQCCDYCGADTELSAWLPEKYASVGYRPGSFSASELIDVCQACVVLFNVSHDPAVPRKPLAAAPFRWL